MNALQGRKAVQIDALKIWAGIAQENLTTKEGILHVEYIIRHMSGIKDDSNS